MSLQVQYSLAHKGAVLLVRSTQDRIIVSSQKGGTTVIGYNDSEEDQYTQQSTLELGELWDIACLEDHLVVANRDGIIRLWSFNTKESIRSFHGHEGTARAVHLPDERTIVSSDITGVIRIWDLSSGECRHVLTGHEGDVSTLASHGDTLISGGYDNRLRVWNMVSGQCIHILEGHEAGIGILSWNEDHTLIAAGASGGAIRVWRVSDGKCITNCVGHTKLPTRIIDLKERLITASADGTVREWDWGTGRMIETIEAHNGDNPAIRMMEFFEDETKMITAGMDGKVKLWDYNGGRCLDELLVDQIAIWAGKKLDKNRFAITGRAKEDEQYLKIYSVGK